MKNVHYFFIAFLIISCSNRKIEYEYFSNGNIKVKAEKLNGENDGVLYEYYNDGKIKLKQSWKNGKIHGLVEEYYPSGKIFRIAHLKDYNFIDAISYYENGEIKSKNFYDKDGEIIDVHRFTDKGVRDTEAYPFFHTIPFGDTLQLGKEAILKARIVNVTDSISRNGQLIITSAIDSFPKTNNIVRVKDTLELISPVNDFDYIYKFIPRKRGNDFIHGQFIFKKKVGEEVFFDISIIHYPIYVTDSVSAD